MSAGKPRVTIIVTTCGRWRLLTQAINSIKTQGFKDYEVLLVNDGVNNPLPDGRAEAYMKEVGVKEPQWRWIDCVWPATKRVSASINQGMDEAKGDFITYLCDDDLWLPGRLGRMVALMDKGNDWAIDSCSWLTAEGLLLEQKYAGFYQYVEPHEEGHEELVQFLIDSYEHNYMVHDCVMFRPTDLRWPTDIEHHVPVDWRFYCALWRRMQKTGGKIAVSKEVGAVAYYPGVWRAGMSMEQALKAREIAGVDGVSNKENDELPGMAKNVSGKTKKVVRAGNTVRVVAGGYVRVEDIASIDGKGRVRLPAGFEHCSDMVIPALDE